jgi:hypothetical protein
MLDTPRRARSLVLRAAPIALFYIIIAVLAIAALRPPQDVSADSPILDNSHPWRFGFGVSSLWGRYIDDYAQSLERLNSGWYFDWGWHISPSRPNGIEYAQLLPVRSAFTDWDNLRAAVLANPGALWLIGNEPDVYNQEDCMPWVYARRYHDYYEFIKALDSSAQVANGAIVQATKLRLQWLSDVWREYQTLYTETMPVDVWNIHEQILREIDPDDPYCIQYPAECFGCGVPQNEADDPLYCLKNGQLVYCTPTDPQSIWVTSQAQTEGRLYLPQDNGNPAIFKQHIQAMRQWMKDHGQQDKPLIISEYAVIYPPWAVPGAQVFKFVKETLWYMLTTTNASLGYPADGYRLVQRWNWFGLNIWPDYRNCPPGFTGNCLGYSGSLAEWDRDELTAYGRLYEMFTQSHIYSLPLATGWNLVSLPISPTMPVSATLFPITDTLYSISGTYDLIYAYKASDAASPWEKYNTAAPAFLNDLKQVDQTQGFWIRATQPVTLMALGKPVALPISITLTSGWNLVGYPITETRALTVALSSIEGKYDLIYEYDAFDTASPWAKYNTAAPSFLNDLVAMRPGKGYWVRVNQNCVWRLE